VQGLLKDSVFTHQVPVIPEIAVLCTISRDVLNTSVILIVAFHVS
jgi:hypothetical protein